MATHLHIVREFWHLWHVWGPAAAAHLAAQGLTVRPVFAPQPAYVGLDEVQRMKDELLRTGTAPVATPHTWEAFGSYVLVSGVVSVAVDGELVDRPLWWVYRLRRDKIESVTSVLSRDEALWFIEADAG